MPANINLQVLTAPMLQLLTPHAMDWPQHLISRVFAAGYGLPSQHCIPVALLSPFKQPSSLHHSYTNSGSDLSVFSLSAL